jgi:hypothetical protein
MTTNIKFSAPPTCAKFMRSEAFFRLIAGPVGSGKTTACIFELLRRAMQQAPATDGLRHTRFAIVRQTLKQLKDTVLKDIEQWLKGLVSYKVSDNTIYVSFADVRSEWLLIPLDDPEDQRRLLSMQLTGAWLSEAIEMDTEIVQPVLGRCGRYPGMGMKPEDFTGQWPTWFGAVADTNMPSEGSDWHKYMELETDQTRVAALSSALRSIARFILWPFPRRSATPASRSRSCPRRAILLSSCRTSGATPAR